MSVTRIEILRRRPFAGGVPFGSAGPYERLEGILHFAVDPAHPANEGIVDLDLAPRDGDGRVAFSADFCLLQPADPAGSSGRLLLEVPNRGRKGTLGRFNRPPEPGAPTRAAEGEGMEIGDGLLLRQGWTVAWCGWQWDVFRPGDADAPPDTAPGLLGFNAPQALDESRTPPGGAGAAAVAAGRPGAPPDAGRPHPPPVSHGQPGRPRRRAQRPGLSGGPATGHPPPGLALRAPARRGGDGAGRALRLAGRGLPAGRDLRAAVHHPQLPRGGDRAAGPARRRQLPALRGSGRGQPLRRAPAPRPGVRLVAVRAPPAHLPLPGAQPGRGRAAGLRRPPDRRRRGPPGGVQPPLRPALGDQDPQLRLPAPLRLRGPAGPPAPAGGRPPHRGRQHLVRVLEPGGLAAAHGPRRAAGRGAPGGRAPLPLRRDEARAGRPGGGSGDGDGGRPRPGRGRGQGGSRPAGRGGGRGAGSRAGWPGGCAGSPTWWTTSPSSARRSSTWNGG